MLLLLMLVFSDQRPPLGGGWKEFSRRHLPLPSRGSWAGTQWRTAREKFAGCDSARVARHVDANAWRLQGEMKEDDLEPGNLL